MSVVYTQSTNKIAITGATYPSGSPCDFHDLYVADTGATKGRQLLDGVIDANPDTFSLDSQVKPADSLAVPLKIECTARAGATCDIVGKDAWGSALSETGIDISSGAVTTTERFSEVNASGITVNGMTNDDNFDVFQDRWGMIWENASLYRMDCQIVVGEDTGDLVYFVDSGISLYIPNIESEITNGEYLIQVMNKGRFTLGVLQDAGDHITSDGVALISDIYRSGYFYYNLIGSVWGSESVINLYSSVITTKNRTAYIATRTNESKVWNCLLTDIRGFSGDSRFTIFNLIMMNSTQAGSSAFHGSVTNVEDVKLYRWGNGVNFANAMRLKNVEMVDCDVHCMYKRAAGDWLDLINLTLDETIIIRWYSAFWSGTGGFQRKYSFNLKTVDNNDVGIEGASVKIEDVNGDEITDSPFTTDVNGDIAEQDITGETYVNGLPTTATHTTTITDVLTPHTVTMTKAGYETRVIKYTMDRKREEIEKLSPDGTNIQDAVLYDSVIY